MKRGPALVRVVNLGLRLVFVALCSFVTYRLVVLILTAPDMLESISRACK